MRVLASTPAVAGVLVLVSCFLAVADLASAKPTDQQLAAIKANCRSDFMSNCWGVPRGGTEAFQCLKDHLPSLSASCQQAVKAVMATATPPANSGTAQTASKPAAEAKPAATAAAPATASSPAEAEKSTPAGSASSSAAAASESTANAAPTGTENAPSASIKSTQGSSAGTGSSSAKAAAKKSATTSATVASQGAGSTGAATAKTKPTITRGAETAASAATSAAATPPALGFIPPRKKLIIARFCRDDFNAHCPGVDVGDGRAIGCLEANKASLTPDCRDALTRLIR